MAATSYRPRRDLPQRKCSWTRRRKACKSRTCRTAERKLERALIADYESLIDELLPRLGAHNHTLAVELASIPEHIRGYGHVKERHLKAAKAKEAELIAAFRAAKPAPASVERVAA